MISGRMLNHTLQDLHDITGADLTLVSRTGELVADYSAAGESRLSAAVSFLASPAETMAVGETHFYKVQLDGRTEYAVIAGGQNGQMAGRIAASTLGALLIAAAERQDKNHFMQNVLLDNLLPVDLRNEARKLKISDEARRVVYLVETSEADNDAALQTLRAIYATTRAGDFIAPLDAMHVAVVTELTAEKEDLAHTAYMICDMLNTEAMISVHVSYGDPADQLLHLSQSYKEAQLSMEVGRIFFPDRQIISYSNLGIGRLIYQLPASLCEIFLKETFDHDVFAELDDETMATIRHFFANNLNISETARQLYIHRNTLVYRIEKLQKTTGLDIRRFDEAMAFKIAMMVHDYLLQTAQG